MHYNAVVLTWYIWNESIYGPCSLGDLGRALVTSHAHEKEKQKISAYFL